MTTNTDSSNIGALERRLADLHRSLDGAVDSAARKRTISLIIMLVMAVAMAIYLFVAFRAIADVQVRDITATLELRAQERLASSRAEMANALKDAAPGIFDEAEKVIMELPQSMVQEARVALRTEIAKATPALEEQLLETVRSSLQALRAEIGAGPNDQISEAQFRQILEKVAESFGLQLTDMVERLYATYRTHFGDHINELTRVAKGETVDQREDRRRRVIMLLKAMYDKYGTPLDTTAPTVSMID